MRFFHNLALATLVAVAAAQGGPNTGEPNPFSIPSGGWHVSAGKSITLKWTPTTGGTVSLKLQWGGINTLAQGVDIATNLPNSGSYTWTPSASLVSEPDYTVKIIDDQDTNEYNFSPRFVISGATGTATAAASTGSSSAAVSTSGSSSASASASTTGSSSASASASTSSSSSSAAASTASGSSTPSSTPSQTAASTTAPNNSGIANAPSALMGLLLGLIALL